jgi:hypothetical protein
MGCWLARGQPVVCLLIAATFAVTAAAARWRFTATSVILLFFSYTSTGLVLALTPAFAATPLWLAALAGFVAGGLPWTTWQSPWPWRWPLMLWLLGIAVSWPIIAAREADFGAILPSDTVPVIIVAAAASLATGLWLDAALSWDLDTIERSVARPLLASVVVASVAVFYQSFVDITWLSSDVWIQARRATGLMGDANPMAVAAALWAPLALLVLRGALRPLAVVLVAILWSAAWLTGARSGLLLIAAGILGLVGATFAGASAWRRAVVLSAAVVAVLAAVVVLARVDTTGPISRVVNALPLDRPIQLAHELFWRRDGYGSAAARAIREHPWSGVGNGAFNHLSTYYSQLEGGPIVPPDNAQNLWRHALAERGVLAFAAIVGVTVVILRLLWQSSPPLAGYYLWTLKAVVIGIGLVLTVGLPTQNVTIALTVACLVAWLHAAVSPRHASPPSVQAPVVVIIWLLALVGAGVDVWTARTDLRLPWRAARLGQLYVRGFGEPESGPGGASGRPVTHRGILSMRIAGPKFALRYWARGEALRHLRVWQDRRLVIDEAIPPGVVVERLLDTPARRPGMMLELESDPPGVVMTGEFVGSR